MSHEARSQDLYTDTYAKQFVFFHESMVFFHESMFFSTVHTKCGQCTIILIGKFYSRSLIQLIGHYPNYEACSHQTMYNYALESKQK